METHDSEFVEVRQKKRAPIATILNVVCAIVIVIGAVYFNDYKMRMRYIESRSDGYKRYAMYAERYIKLNNEKIPYVDEWYAKCYLVSDSKNNKTRCDRLDYLIKRYSREIQTVNKAYQDGQWVTPDGEITDHKPYVPWTLK